jgi:hypothetical protein
LFVVCHGLKEFEHHAIPDERFIVGITCFEEALQPLALVGSLWLERFKVAHSVHERRQVVACGGDDERFSKAGPDKLSQPVFDLSDVNRQVDGLASLPHSTREHLVLCRADIEMQRHETSTELSTDRERQVGRRDVRTDRAVLQRSDEPCDQFTVRAGYGR